MLSRYIIAIAGPPGAGKSTFAQDLAVKLPNSKVLQMDGFHYDNSILDQLGLRARKGAPETFDYPGFEAILKRIRDRDPDIAIPVFDRTIDMSRAAADLIHQQTEFIIVEGNYLLLDEPPWTGLAKYFDLTIFLNVPGSELQRRLIQRWLDHGRTQQQAEHWVTTNDLPNVDRVLTSRRKPNLTLTPS